MYKSGHHNTGFRTAGKTTDGIQKSCIRPDIVTNEKTTYNWKLRATTAEENM
jgi:hypothetical protein